LLEGIREARARGRRVLSRDGTWWAPNRGLFRASIAREIGGMRKHLAGECSADLPWLLRLALVGEFVRVPESLVVKRFTQQSFSRMWQHNRWQRFGLQCACIRAIRCAGLPLADELLLQLYVLQCHRLDWTDGAINCRAPRLCQANKWWLPRPPPGNSKGLLALVYPTLTCPGSRPGLFTRRSPPRLFTAAARAGLRPAPESRSRGARPHLLCIASSTPSVLLQYTSCPLISCLVGRSYVRYVVHLSLARARQVNSLGTIVSVIVGHDLGRSRAYITGCKRYGDGAAGPRQESRRGHGAVVRLSEIACIRPHDLDAGDRKRTAAVVGENRALRCARSALALCTEIETTWRHAHWCNGRDNTGSSAQVTGIVRQTAPRAAENYRRLVGFWRTGRI
jgi:hypothetical protein